jgi:hypothetical protein
VQSEFLQIINRISSKGETKAILERFKHYFAAAAGEQSSSSSSVDWAMTDLERHMDSAAGNAPLYIDAFWLACESLKKRYPELPYPSTERINRILADKNAGYQIRDSELVATRERERIPVPERTPSLDERAQALIAEAEEKSDRALGRGDGRQAVQELLWVLETIATAFRGSDTEAGTIEGKYFNMIVRELQADGMQGPRKVILDWMMKVHGFLSSPTGGGIRHGLDLKDGSAVTINEARLYCNLIRSYIGYLIEEHERLCGTQRLGRGQ